MSNDKINNAARLIEICEQVSIDVEKDANSIDGKPFNGRTMGEYMGYHGAAIGALASALVYYAAGQAIDSFPVDDGEEKQDEYELWCNVSDFLYTNRKRSMSSVIDDLKANLFNH